MELLRENGRVTAGGGEPPGRADVPRSERPTGSIGRGVLVIGWREPVCLPEWGIEAIKTKVDTGARTSAIHVDTVEELAGGRVRFEVVLEIGKRGRVLRTVTVEADLVRRSRVRPSSGKRQERPVVSTVVRIGPVERVVELSLVRRERMLCRMLLGRRALAGAFLIDPSRAVLVGAPARTKKRKKRGAA